MVLSASVTLEIIIFSTWIDEEAKEHSFYEEKGIPVPKKETEGLEKHNICSVQEETIFQKHVIRQCSTFLSLD
jgi:hypothetical protein